ncbi:MAG: hypothetical protein LBN00_08860 [Oscillospiraceae bacterium]|jgi:hypothetical protein|nr:hypothetical protein [Oscillospiraceae bacterium]
MRLKLTPRRIVILCCLFAAAVSSAPIFRHVLPWAHDIHFHLTRIEGVYQGLLSGQFPVRINPAFLNGYGYADPIMYPPLFLYFPALLRILGFSPLTSYQVFIFAVNLMTAGISYLCAKRFFKSGDVALFAMLAYTLCLYRLICIFTRAAVGEIIGMAFLPCVFLGMYELLRGDAKHAKWLLTAGFVGLINCHVLSALIAAEACFVILLFNLKRFFTAERVLALAEAAAATLLLTLWVIVPMLHIGTTDLNVRYAAFDSYNHAVYPVELFATFIKADGLSEELKSPFTGMPLTVGGIFGLGLIIYMYIRFAKRDRDQSGVRGAFFLALGALFAASTLFPWRLAAELPVVGRLLVSVQFPWRYLGIASVGLAVVLTCGVAHFAESAEKHRHAILFVCALAVIFAVSPYYDNYLQNDKLTAALADSYAKPNTTMLGGQEYLRHGTGKDALLERGTGVVGFGAEINNIDRDYTTVTFDFEGAQDGAYAELPLYYYPGYVAEDEYGGALTADAGENGVVRVNLPSGTRGGTVTVRYREPAVYRIAEVISLLTIIILTIKYRRDILNFNIFRRKD